MASKLHLIVTLILHLPLLGLRMVDDQEIVCTRY